MFLEVTIRAQENAFHCFALEGANASGGPTCKIEELRGRIDVVECQRVQTPMVTTALASAPRPVHEEGLDARGLFVGVAFRA
jgi:hypothetical protein